MGRLIALLVALVLGASIAWQGEKTPAPKPVTAPTTEFSAMRAMPDIVAIASVPHPVGSAANQRARDYLVRRMAELGLSPQVQSADAVQLSRRAPGIVVGGHVENIVGVLPGRDRSLPAVALMAHYDSVPGSPGAADDAAGTAAVLEAVRAIKARGQPARDVIALITDGEEAGLLGASAFFRTDPMAKRIGLVINLEARGNGGRAQMFQTSPGDGPLIGLIQGGDQKPVASSLSSFVYDKMPNDTDLTESLRARIVGLNYAFAGYQFDYHSPTSTPATLQKGALQDIGQQALAAAAAAAFADHLPTRGPVTAYSQTLGGLFIAYPAGYGWIPLAVAALLIVVAIGRARRIEAFPWSDVLRGAGALIFAVAGAIALLQFARHATGAGFGYLEQRFLLAQVTRWETAIALTGLGFLLLAAAELARGRRVVVIIPLLAGIGSCVFRGLDPIGLGAGLTATVFGLAALGRPVSRGGPWAGVLIVGLALGVVAQVLAPPVAFVIGWPLLVGAVAAAATDMGTRRGIPAQMLLGLLAALTLGWAGGYFHSGFISLDLMVLMALPLIMAALVIWPLAQPADGAPPGRWLGAALVLAGLAVTAWVRFADPYDARHPEVTQMAYLVDLDARRAWLVSYSPDQPAWSRQALKAAGGGAPQKLKHWLYPSGGLALPQPFVEETPPAAALTRRGDGAYVLHLSPPPGGAVVGARLKPDKDAVLETLAGHPVDMKLAANRWSTVRFSGSSTGTDVVLRPSAPGTLTIRVASTLPRWPAGARPLPPRPPNVMAWDVSDGTTVTVTRRYAW